MKISGQVSRKDFGRWLGCIVSACGSLLLGAPVSTHGASDEPAVLLRSFASSQYQAVMMAKLKGTLIFSASDTEHGKELWKSDGTSEGTVLVKDIRPGSEDGVQTEDAAVVADSFVCFVANDGLNGNGLWRTDGSGSGTFLLKNIYPEEMVAVGGMLYFRSYDEVIGSELWISDGTAEGTRLLKDINPGLTSSDPLQLANVNGTLFFVVNDGVHGRELWKSNGTAKGTVLVADLLPGAPGALDGSNPDYFAPHFWSYLTAVGSTLYFAANTESYGVQLWKSDGTAPGTVLLQDVKQPLAYSYPTFLSNWQGKLVFSATTLPDGGFSVYQTSGTAAGTSLIKAFPYIPNSAYHNPGNFLGIGNKLFFASDEGSNGYEPWVSDGTTAGTQLLKDIAPGQVLLSNPGTQGKLVPASSFPGQYTAVNDLLYFVANDGGLANGFGEEVWVSDGTPAGTKLAADLYPGDYGSSPRKMVAINGTLFISTLANQLYRVGPPIHAVLHDIILSASELSFRVPGGASRIALTTTSAWSASSADSWIRIAADSKEGVGDHTLHFTVTRNRTGISRTGTISIGGKILTIYQAGSTSFKTLAGSYTGPVQDALGEHATAGTFSLTLGASGAFTGSARIGGKRLSLKGVMADEEHMVHGRLADAAPRLNLQILRETGLITGSLQWLGNGYSLTLTRKPKAISHSGFNSAQ